MIFRSANRILERKFLVKRPFGIQRPNWEDNIRMYLRELYFIVVDLLQSMKSIVLE
jgi:hypothetical protein